MFEGRTDDIMEEGMLQSTKIKQETDSKFERSCEFEDPSFYDCNDNHEVKIKKEAVLTTDQYNYDSVEKETDICNCIEIKEECKQEIEEDYGGQNDVGQVVFKREADGPTIYLESDNDKKVSPLCISQAKSLPDDTQATPTDILMALKNNNYGLLNEYITKK